MSLNNLRIFVDQVRNDRCGEVRVGVNFEEIGNSGIIDKYKMRITCVLLKNVVCL